jgi:hypothetical protein
MPKILPVAIFIGVMVILSQFARTPTDLSRPSEAAEMSSQANQFRLKQSYNLGAPDSGLLATVYSCGEGTKEKEILSIWSRESDAYELQYIRTAAAGQAFNKPDIFSIEKMSFVKISTKNRQTGQAAMESVLSITPEFTLHEIQANQAKHLIKIQNGKA